MKTSDKIGVQYLVAHLVKNDVETVVCSPGSRNAPLVIALDEHPQINCLVIHDERVAAFYALGIIQQTQKPVAVVCTSGSALLNYFPAVSEAFYQQLPLVIVSADRPQEWINHGDGQTIMQTNVFGKHVIEHLHLKGEGHSDSEIWAMNRDLAFAFEQQRQKPGPIHLNMALIEPLYQTVEQAEVKVERLQTFKLQKGFSENALKEIRSGLSLPSKWVLIGQGVKDAALQLLIDQFANDSSVIVFVENISNMTHPRFIHGIDRWLAAVEDIETFKPDLIISLGGAIVSKRIKSVLRSWSAIKHWQIGEHQQYQDTFQHLSHVFDMSPLAFFKELSVMDYERNQTNVSGRAKAIDIKAKDAAKSFIQQAPFSDLVVFDHVLDFMPDGTHLHLANSSVVRYAQLFDPISNFTYWSNRGTSGIDGSSSTACGAAWMNQKELHVLITGDVSFFYDSNAFWTKYLTGNLRVILINNGGGDIFNIIPGPNQTEQKDQYFVAKHQTSAKPICDLYAMEYFSIFNLMELENNMAAFYAFSENNRPKLMEIHTDGELNAKILNNYFNHLKR